MGIKGQSGPSQMLIRVQITWEYPYVLTSGCGLSPRLCIPNQLLGDAAATALEPQQGRLLNSCFQLFRF